MNSEMNVIEYIAPAYRAEVDASAFAGAIALRAQFAPDALGGAYAWDAPIPPRSEWDREIDAMIEHYESL